MILPYMEQQNLYATGIFRTNVFGNAALARTDIAGFYCPTRRSRIRPEDKSPRCRLAYLSDAWWATTPEAASIGPPAERITADASEPPMAGTTRSAGNGTITVSPTTAAAYRQWEALDLQGGDKPPLVGIFLPNIATKFADLKDGASNVIMRARCSGSLGWATTQEQTSQDGWALGGVATLFRHGQLRITAAATSTGKGGLNNELLRVARQRSSGGHHFGIADGSVRMISENIDSNVFDALGSMADGRIASIP